MTSSEHPEVTVGGLIEALEDACPTTFYEDTLVQVMSQDGVEMHVVAVGHADGVVTVCVAV